MFPKYKKKFNIELKLKSLLLMFGLKKAKWKKSTLTFEKLPELRRKWAETIYFLPTKLKLNQASGSAKRFLCILAAEQYDLI